MWFEMPPLDVCKRQAAAEVIKLLTVYAGELFLDVGKELLFPISWSSVTLTFFFLFSFLFFPLSSSNIFWLFFTEFIPQAFSIPLSQVIANDRAHRQRQDSFRQDPPQREEHKDSSDLVSSILQVRQLVCMVLPLCVQSFNSHLQSWEHLGQMYLHSRE